MTEQSDDFLNEMRHAVRALPTPEPTDTLLGRILEDRRLGYRVELPGGPARLRPATTVAIVAAAAALVLWIVSVPDRVSESQSATSQNSVFGEFAAGLGLWPDQLYAQAATTATLPPIPPRDGSLLHSGRWIYSFQVLDEDGKITSEHPFSVSITAGSFEGTPAWLVVRQRNSNNPGSAVDTVWSSRNNLLPLARFSPLASDASLRTSFIGDSAVRVWRKPGGELERVALPLPSPRLWQRAAVFAPSELWPLFLTTKLDASWQGSFAGTAIANTRELVTLWWDLKVVGEERVTVPAGTFECWKIASLYRDDPVYMYWVDKSSGWIVRESGVPAGRFARALMSHAAR